jgi:polysaccharide pyruvyl transferase WcaK-like protein
MQPGQPLRAVLFNATERNGHHGCALVAQQIDLLAKEAGIEIVRRLSLHIPRRFDAFSDYDVVLVNGEGSVHHDKPGAQHVAEISRYFERIGKPAYLINTSYEANSAAISEGVGRYRLIFVRDSVSRGELAKANVAATVVPDLSLTWQHRPGARAGKKLVVVDSVNNSVSADLYDLATTAGGQYTTIKTAPPPLPDIPGNNLARRAKYSLRRAYGGFLKPGWRREKLRPRYLALEDFATAIFGETALIVSGRFHGVCMALVLEVPVIGLRSNTSKVEALLKDAGLSGRTAGSVEELRGVLARSKLEDFAFTDDEIERIRDFRQRASANARAMFAAIAADAKAPATR